jgi:hypothetical protein
MRGQPFGFVAPVIQIRGDWPALCEWFACRQWSHKHHPCMFCTAKHADLVDSSYCSGVSPDNSSHSANDAGSHIAEIIAHSIEVLIADPDVQREVFTQLRYGSHRSRKGRFLARDIDSLNLKAGDRLEPCVGLRNIAELELKPTPFTCLFWRGTSSDRITHASPLMNIEGVSLEIYGVDMLHTWALGCVQVYVGFVLWHFVRSRVLGSGVEWMSAEAGVRNLGCFVKVGELFGDWGSGLMAVL